MPRGTFVIIHVALTHLSKNIIMCYIRDWEGLDLLYKGTDPGLKPEVDGQV